MPDIGTADVKPSDFTSQQCQYLAYSHCCHAITNTYRCECRYSNMHNYNCLFMWLVGWRSMSYNGIIDIAHEKFQKLLLPFDYHVLWLALSSS